MLKTLLCGDYGQWHGNQMEILQQWFTQAQADLWFEFHSQNVV